MIELDYKLNEKVGFSHVIDLLGTCSPYGTERKKKLRVYDNTREAELTDEFYNISRVMTYMGEHDCTRIERRLLGLKDIRGSVGSIDSLSLNDIELFELKRFLLQLELIADDFSEMDSTCQLKNIDIAPFTEALEVLDPDGMKTQTFMLSSSLSEELCAIRREKKDIEILLRKEMDQERRATLLRERARITAMEDAEETRLRAMLCEKLLPYKQGLLNVIDALGSLDFTLARARLALRYGCCCPSISQGGLELSGMINPAIQDALEKRGKRFTPVSMQARHGVTVITGANMGGKTVALNTVALNVLCVHCAIFPFARHAQVPLFDRLYLIAEDMQDSSKGLSSFGAEMMRLDAALLDIKKHDASLLLIDELARGTNPDEGACIVKGVVNMLKTMSVISVLTTHYDNVACYADAHYQVKGLCGVDMQALTAQIAKKRSASVELIEEYMNYGIIRVDTASEVPKDALRICELLGIDKELLIYVKKYIDK